MGILLYFSYTIFNIMDKWINTVNHLIIKRYSHPSLQTKTFSFSMYEWPLTFVHVSLHRRMHSMSTEDDPHLLITWLVLPDIQHLPVFLTFDSLPRQQRFVHRPCYTFSPHQNNKNTLLAAAWKIINFLKRKYAVHFRDSLLNTKSGIVKQKRQNPLYIPRCIF